MTGPKFLSDLRTVREAESLRKVSAALCLGRLKEEHLFGWNKDSVS